MKTPIIPVLLAMLLVAGVGSYWLLSGGTENSGIEDANIPAWQKEVQAAPGLSAEAKAEEHYRGLVDPAERIKLIDWIVEQTWARPNRGVLAKAVASDKDESVRLHALNKALELGQRSGQTEAKREALRAAFGSNSQTVALAALAHAREHPDPALVPDLLSYADDIEDARTLSCWNALAFTDDPAAKAKINQLAHDTALPHAHRVRAVTLLAKTLDPEAKPLLESLASSDDEELQKIAQAVLEEYTKQGR